jgi:undecaprenyl diphosphate synthase
VTEDLFISQLTTATMPDPELLIRTSGEHHSNYLLWQMAYAELYLQKNYADFRRRFI